MTAGTKHQDVEAKKIDPLVWHYERERRITISGSVQWEHTVKSKNSALNFRIRSNFRLRLKFLLY